MSQISQYGMRLHKPQILIVISRTTSLISVMRGSVRYAFPQGMLLQMVYPKDYNVMILFKTVHPCVACKYINRVAKNRS